jgi:MFS family permease
MTIDGSAMPQIALPPSRVRYVVLGWLCLAAMIAYIQRNSIGVAESTMREELRLSEKQMGWAMSAFFVSYALFQLPAGWLGHVLGTRHALAAFAFCWSAITGLLAYVQGFYSLLAVRLGMGAAQAGIFPCSTSSLAVWFPQRRRSLASGSLASFMSIGGALGPALAGQLLFDLGWRGTFALFALPGLVWAVLFWLWFRDDPKEHSSVNAAELILLEGEPGQVATQAMPLRRAREPVPWIEILSSRAMWWIGGQQFFRAAAQIFFATWFATYLQKTRGVTVGQSGWLTAFAVFAIVLGSLSGGLISDWLLAKTGSRRLARQYLAASTTLVCGILVFVAYGIPGAGWAVAVISIGTFFSAIAGPCAYTITIDLGGRHITTVFSFMNMCGNIGASVFPLIVPYFVEFTGDWNAVLFLFGAINFAAAACWLSFRADQPIVKSSYEAST